MSIANKAVLWVLFCGLLLSACKQSDELLYSIEGTYTFQRFAKNGKDSVYSLSGMPIPITQSEIILNNNGYKGTLRARFQGQIDTIAAALIGEYYVALRSFKREGTNNVVTPKSIIFGIDTVYSLRKAFPYTDTLRIDTLRLPTGLYKPNNTNLFIGEWGIDKLPTAPGELLQLRRRGFLADSVNTYTLDLLLNSK